MKTGSGRRAAAQSVRAKLLHRLSWYWQVEAANVVLMPLIMVVLSKAQLGPLAALAIAAMSGMLVVGTIYLRSKYRQVAFGEPIDRALKIVMAAQVPMLASCLMALGIMAWGWLQPGTTHGLAERWVITAAAVLAALEYINYYHRQLQHFDNAGDWRRLLSGRGFRKSQLRRDLERAGLRPGRAGS